MQHPAESGRYVKLYNAMLYYIVNLIAFNLLVNNTTDTLRIIVLLLLHSSICQRSLSSDKGTKYQVLSVCPRIESVVLFKALRLYDNN